MLLVIQGCFFFLCPSTSSAVDSISGMFPTSVSTSESTKFGVVNFLQLWPWRLLQHSPKLKQIQGIFEWHFTFQFSLVKTRSRLLPASAPGYILCLSLLMLVWEHLGSRIKSVWLWTNPCNIVAHKHHPLHKAHGVGVSWYFEVVISILGIVCGLYHHRGKVL